MPSPYSAHPHAHAAIVRFVPRLVLGILLNTFCAAGFAADAPLTLGKAQQLAIARSRQLTAQDSAVTASRDMAVAASQLPDPTIKFGIDNLPVTTSDRFSITDDFMTMRYVGLAQELTGADKRKRRAERYEREAEKSLAAKTVAIAAIQRDTALSWLDRYYSEQTAALIADQDAQARLDLAAAESAYRGGHGTQADVFAARSALVMIEDRISEIARRVGNTKIMLTRWTGTTDEAPLISPPNIDAIRLDPATLENHFLHHPEIAVLTKQEEIAEADVNLAQANKTVDWSVEVSYQQRGYPYSNMISIGLSIPFQWDQSHRQDRELSSKLALVEQAKAEREEMLREHVAQTRTMIADWQNDRDRHDRYEHELLPLANERTQAMLAAYRGGKVTLVELLSARRNEIDVRLQALQLDADTARLWAQLNYLFPDDSLVSPHSRTVEEDTQ